MQANFFFLFFTFYGKDKKTIEDMKKRDEKRFKIADADNDGQLDEEELALFTHPEESARMTNVIVQVITLTYLQI